MTARIVVLVGLFFVPLPVAAQQTPSSTDSLVAYWLRRGALANWGPAQLFSGCPDLADWQRRGIDLVLNANLSREREDQLAIEWGIALEGCRYAQVENWLFDRVDAAIARGEHPWGLLPYWEALGNADSPAVRAYLRALMLDTSKAEWYRDEAGATLFKRYGPDERMREYLATFETRRMPFETQIAETTLLLEAQPERLLREVGRRVRENPDLAEQGAFILIVESADRYASASLRRALAGDIAEGLRRHPKTGRQLERLQSAMDHLRREQGRLRETS